MKKINNLIFIVSIFLTLNSAFSTFGAVRWSVDFENGFTASDGTAVINLGNLSNPFDSNQQVYLLYDSSKASNVLRVKRNWQGSNARLHYQDLAASVFGESGKVTLDFKIPAELDPNFNNICFVNPSELTGESATLQNHWWIGLGGASETPNKNLVAIRSGCYWPIVDAGNYTKTTYNYMQQIPVFESGWHSYEFIWYRTEDNDPERDRADIMVKIDGEVALAMHNAYWTWPGSTKVAIGCEYMGSPLAPTRQAGYADNAENPVLIDNVKVWDYTPLICGQPGVMEYMDADINNDCYIGLSDMKVLAENWLKCTDPENTECDEYWR
ncbi:MAG: hypothetical protein LLF92_03480 [Planctomycetaceae bacterium]|nr:hypothetical protein [Planctomycetaceae bacterium]